MTLHIINFHFEDELLSSPHLSLFSALSYSKFYLQAQFLPFLYAKPEDSVYLTHLPQSDYLPELAKTLKRAESDFPKVFTEKMPGSFERIEYWGVTPSLINFASSHKIPLNPPPLEAVYGINSNEFRYKHKVLPENSYTLHTPKDLNNLHLPPESLWIIKGNLKRSGRKQFKTAFPFSPSVDKFIKIELENHQPVFIEPCFSIIKEWSSLWHIRSDKTIEYLGFTFLETHPKGAYRATEIIPLDQVAPLIYPFIEMQKTRARKIVEKAAQLGYFGYIGIDAFIYQEGEQYKLNPISDINGRLTMGIITLKTYQRLGLFDKFRFESYPSQKETSLLPIRLQGVQELLPFRCNISSFS